MLNGNILSARRPAGPTFFDDRKENFLWSIDLATTNLPAHASRCVEQSTSWAIPQCIPSLTRSKMAKRGADDHGDEQALKAGERPVADDPVGEGEDFEDEFEDEFESEDEIFEAGVDGRPDEEREAEERANGTLSKLAIDTNWY